MQSRREWSDRPKLSKRTLKMQVTTMTKTMFRILALVCCVLPACTQAWTQDWAKDSLGKSPRHQEWVDIKYGNRTVHAFVVYPEVKSKAPAVLVIHEIFGLTDWAREAADEVAAAGYVAIAPDLLSGFGSKGGGTSDFASQDDAVKAVSGLDPGVVTADLNATADYVKKLPAANGKLAVAGFCWGGGQSFRFATTRQDLSAAFVFYGPPPKDVSGIHAPVYGFYAGNDARIDATIPDTAAAMKAAGKKYDPVTYDGAGHGFMRAGEDPTRTTGNEANVKARTDAWARWTELLKGL
jgi:carboxymethylenebutenolidase